MYGLTTAMTSIVRYQTSFVLDMETGIWCLLHQLVWDRMMKMEVRLGVLHLLLHLGHSGSHLHRHDQLYTITGNCYYLSDVWFEYITL